MRPSAVNVARVARDVIRVDATTTEGLLVEPGEQVVLVFTLEQAEDLVRALGVVGVLPCEAADA